ncbi:hypothetical protein PVAND_015874 [Polypedilum vanderplanki]|uniref:EF-hand domain-containing protein n=1 Tax=Polypedilum vanderplanki TaxID=319348 RepID=A0A9J6BDU3_POLVA|nr:hypothetical protein PVAND_015874 [Polypedilum vanderplanki]
MAYQGYNPYQPATGNSQVQNFFTHVDKDGSGKINAQELQQALINGQGQQFSDTACNMMISMFDQDRTGTIDITEFERLFNYINSWLSCFKAFDRDNSGSIEESELSAAFQQMGFRFSQQFINFLIVMSDPKERTRISVDQFIVLCVKIQKFTEAFKQRDTEMTGVIKIAFEDFLGIALGCSN